MTTLTKSLIALIASAVITIAAMADENRIPEPFRGETKGSPIQIRYDDWNMILVKTVTAGGRSNREKAAPVRAKVGTRVVRGNSSSLRNEGNRIAFPAFKGENLQIVTAIRKSLEALPGSVPMREWSKNEQLAYWLNLYNITIVEQIAKEYPVRKIDKLMKSSRKKPSLWNKKLLNVADIPLSLNDIQFTILANKWDSSLVMYGLFQGYIGSPNIMKRAFTGENVHSMLVRNATEFVNSNRGMQARGSTLLISELYKTNKVFFPNWEDDLKKHFASLVDYSYRPKVMAARKIKARTKDYYIADLFGGGKLPGSGTNTNSAALNDARVIVNSGVASGEAGISFSMEQYSDMRRDNPDIRFPEHVIDYVKALRKRKAGKEGVVEVEEVEDRVEKKDN